MSDLLRLSGLNSGFDTEAMIEKMLQTYQSKIDTQNKKLTKLTWQQDAYRDVITKLTTFKNKYFDILNRQNYLLSPTSFKKFAASVTNKSNPDKVGGISVTTSASSLEGSHTVRLIQAATATKVTGKAISSPNFELDLNKAANYSDYTVEVDEETGASTRNYSFALDVKVGDVTRTIEFDVSVAQDDDGNIDMDEFANAVKETLNDKFEAEFGLTGKTSSSTGVTGGLNAEGKERFLSVEIGDDGKMNFLVGGNASVTIAERTGDFGMARPTSSVSIAAQACVTGRNSVSVTVNGITKKVSFDGVSDTYFESRNEEGNEDILAEYTQLKIEAYKNDHWGFEPTDEELENYSYSSAQAARDKNARALADALNKAFGPEDTGTDDGDVGEVPEEPEGTDEPSGVDADDELGEEPEVGEEGEGEETEEPEEETGIRFTLDIFGNLTCNAGEFTITAVEGGTLGISKASTTNKLSVNSSLKDLGIASGDEDVTFTINGKEISVESTASVSDLIKAVNNSGAGVTMTYSSVEGRLVVTANDMGSGGDVKIEANKFTAALGLADDENTPMSAEIGQNAIFELDGVEIYHNSNSYTFDGTTLDFTGAEADTEYTISITKSYDDVKQAIKDFVNDYNQLIDDIYDYIGTAPKRDNKNNLYEPLTDEEKAEMSEKEIEKWEEAAKQGVLYNDPTISSIMSNLRMVLYNAVDTADGGKFGLFNMGIKTMDYKADSHGKLVLDEDALNKAFENHADDIVKLFTDTETGVMGKVNKILDDAVRSTGNSKGSLVRKAGIKGSTSTAKDNEIYRKMEQINKRIATLQDRYTAKENYWWNIFTNLEKMMANMNNQSSYLANYFGNTGNYQ